MAEEKTKSGRRIQVASKPPKWTFAMLSLARIGAFWRQQPNFGLFWQQPTATNARRLGRQEQHPVQVLFMSGESVPPVDASLQSFVDAHREVLAQYLPCTDDWDIFEACEISVREQRRRNNGKEVYTLTYGELNFESLAEILHYMKYEAGALTEGEVFYDLGSGTGKAVLAAAVMHPFKACSGVELLPGLHEVALEHKKAWGEGRGTPSVEFYLGSIFDSSCRDWSDGDVVFANSHCFDDEMMEDLSRAAERLKAGAFFVTTTKSLDRTLSGFQEITRFPVHMSWGTADAIIYQKS